VNLQVELGERERILLGPLESLSIDIIEMLIHKVKVKVKVALEETTKAQSGSRGIDLLIL
jgi:hypothetical protein